MKPAPHGPANPFWGLLVLTAGAFCLTTLGYIAAGFGEREVPINAFFNQHGASLIVVEACVTMATGLLALLLDRRQSRAEDRSSPSSVRSDRSDAPGRG